MAVVAFVYYLHDNTSHNERMQMIGEQIDLDIEEALREKIGRPFYEVALDCTLDTATGEVRILGAHV